MLMLAFFFFFLKAAFMTSSFRLWLTKQELLSSALCQRAWRPQPSIWGLVVATSPASSGRNESREERRLIHGWPQIQLSLCLRVTASLNLFLFLHLMCRVALGQPLTLPNLSGFSPAQ